MANSKSLISQSTRFYPAAYGTNFKGTGNEDDMEGLRPGTLLLQGQDEEDGVEVSRLWQVAPPMGQLCEEVEAQEIIAQNAINVRSLGADPTGRTGSGAIINRAIEEAKQRRWGRVYIPAGKYLIEESIQLDSLLWLHGDGYSSFLFAKDGLDAPVIEASYDPGVSWSYMQAISDLRIDGNRENQTNSTSSTAHGIRWQASSASSGLPRFEDELIGPARIVSSSGLASDGQWPDTNRHAHNLFISYCGGDGFICTGRGGIHLYNIVAYENAGYGFSPIFDTTLSQCQAARNGKAGFNASVSSLRLVGCKAWWSGYRNPSGWSNEFSHGFVIQGQGIALSGCEAQDNYAHGFLFNNAYGNVATGCIADSNNRRQADDVGVSIRNSWGNRFDGYIWDRYNDSIWYQQRALEIVGSSQNIIRVTHRRNGGSSTNVASQNLSHYSETTDSLGGNTISINNYDGHQSLTGTVMSPSIYDGRNMRISLGANLTFNHNTSSRVHEGAEMELNFFQSGSGGYTVTFGADFDVGSGFTPSGTVGHYSTIKFRWTGAKWVKTGEMIGV